MCEDKEPWYKIQYIYKNADINITDEMDKWAVDQEMDKLDEAETIVVTKWLIAEDIYSIEEATEKTKHRYGRGDIYLLYISGDSPMHCIVEDIEKFLSEVGPKKRI